VAQLNFPSSATRGSRSKISHKTAFNTSFDGFLDGAVQSFLAFLSVNIAQYIAFVWRKDHDLQAVARNYTVGTHHDV